MNLKNILVGGLLVLLLVVVGACVNEEANINDNGTDKTNNNLDKSDELTGDVVIDGSGTVYPLMAKIAEHYMLTEEQNVSVEVSRAGTSAGFKKFLVENGTDFNNASREIKDEEKVVADEIGIEIQQLKVALDGLTFVINKENDWAKEMTADELKQIFLASSPIEKWSDIRADWPDEPINTYGPNENHGTYEFFYENVLEEQDLKDNIDLQQEYSTLVNLIADDKYGIAFFGYGYYANNTNSLQAVSVDFGEGAVKPSLDTIAEDGPYAPFTRPVFTYLNVNNAKEKPQVLDFAIYALTHLNDFAGETGFAPLPDQEIQENINLLKKLN